MFVTCLDKINVSILHILYFDTQIWVLKSQSFWVHLISSEIALNMYSYLYMWHTYSLYQIGLVSKECAQQRLKTHGMFAPISSFMKTWSYNFNNDLNFNNDISFLYLLITLWMIFKITFIKKNSLENSLWSGKICYYYEHCQSFTNASNPQILSTIKPTTYTSWKHFFINFERNITERLL